MEFRKILEIISLPIAIFILISIVDVFISFIVLEPIGAVILSVIGLIIPFILCTYAGFQIKRKMKTGYLGSGIGGGATLVLGNLISTAIFFVMTYSGILNWILSNLSYSNGPANTFLNPGINLVLLTITFVLATVTGFVFGVIGGFVAGTVDGKK